MPKESVKLAFMPSPHSGEAQAELGRFAPITGLDLNYKPPLAWEALLGFLGGRGAAGVEAVVDGRYLRTVRLGEASGWLAVSPAAESTSHRLTVEFSPSLKSVIEPLTAKLRALLDLDAEPLRIAAHFASDPFLAPIAAATPGLRVPGGFDGFELTLRAILGQQVTVKAATTLFGRFAAAFGEPIATPFPQLTHLSPSAARIADADLQTLINLGLTQRRAQTISDVARAYVSGALRLEPGCDTVLELARFRAIAGIGDWTASYVAMRALRLADAFPSGDLALCKALGGIKPRAAEARSEAWRPWRSYAALYLWRSLHSGVNEAGG